MSTHTATPWCVLEGDTFGIVDDESRDIALDVCYEDDAVHIVKCVNHHDELVAALAMIRDAARAARTYGYFNQIGFALEAFTRADVILAKLDAQS